MNADLVVRQAKLSIGDEYAIIRVMRVTVDAWSARIKKPDFYELYGNNVLYADYNTSDFDEVSLSYWAEKVIDDICLSLLNSCQFDKEAQGE